MSLSLLLKKGKLSAYFFAKSLFSKGKLNYVFCFIRHSPPDFKSEFNKVEEALHVNYLYV